MCGCLITWFCYQLIAKPGNKTAASPWHHPYYIRADSRFVPNQWEMLLQSNGISHWLGTNLEYALLYVFYINSRKKLFCNESFMNCPPPHIFSSPHSLPFILDHPLSDSWGNPPMLISKSIIHFNLHNHVSGHCKHITSSWAQHPGTTFTNVFWLNRTWISNYIY